MKRYNSTYDIYDEDMVEDINGQWVDADIARELYDALKCAMKYFDQVIIETGYQSRGEALAHNKCKQALLNAEED